MTPISYLIHSIQRRRDSRKYICEFRPRQIRVSWRFQEFFFFNMGFLLFFQFWDIWKIAAPPLPLSHRDGIWANFISHTSLILFEPSAYGLGCILLCIKKEEHISVERKGRCSQSDQDLGHFENLITFAAYTFSADRTLFLRGTASRPLDDPSSTGHIYILKKTVCFFIRNTTSWDYYIPHILNLHVRCPQSGVNKWLQCLFHELKKLTPLDIYPLLGLHIPSHSNHPSPYLYPRLTHHQPWILLPQPKLPLIPKHQ